MQTNYLPYGTDCFWVDKARFTNGRTIPEMIAISLNVPWPVTYDEIRFFQDHAVNYASASAGILPETGTAFGKNFCLEKQIGLFRETIQNVVQPRLQSIEESSKYLSKSIYVINIGSSDYLFNYLQPNSYNSSRLHSGEDFAWRLVSELGNQIKALYDLGARKFLIFQIGPLGCWPYIINKLKPQTQCAEEVNKLVSIFNDKLNDKLEDLSKDLSGSAFVIAKTYPLIESMIKSPLDYGFEETRWPCCVTQSNGSGLCITRDEGWSPASSIEDPAELYRFADMEYSCKYIPPTKPHRPKVGLGKPKGYLCYDRRWYLFFDELHLTEAAYQIIVDKCLTTNSTNICSPFGIDRLMEI